MATSDSTTRRANPRILRLRDIEGREREVSFSPPRMLIGRAPDADLRLDHAMVSRRHAEIIELASGRLLARDLGSRNGINVGGIRVTEYELPDGGQVGIGPFTLTLQALSPAMTMLSAPRLPVRDAAGTIKTLDEVPAPQVHAAHLLKFSEFGQRLLELPDLSQRTAALCELMVGGLVHGRWAAVVRIDQDDNAAVLGERRVGGEEPYLSRSVLRAIRQKRSAVLASNVDAAADLQVSIVANVRPMATIACPLTDAGAALDLLYVMLPPEYGTGEWLALATLAARQFCQADAAWAARRAAQEHAVVERDLERARQIQLRLVPENPAVPGLDVAIGFAPCRWVGGDYVDAIPTSDGRLLLAIADVCGKGLSAALVASSLHAIVHSAVSSGLGLATLIQSLNNYLHARLPGDSFVTMIAMLVEPSTGRIEYVSAGHPAPLILSATGEVRSLDEANHLPLSLHSGAFEIASASILPGELLALFTDGLTELPLDSGEYLDITGLIAELQRFAADPRPTRDLVAALDHRLAELQAHHDPVDDRTFLLLRRVG
ncbi:MAG: SpoIIE family protein phosphatase [Tepidisphaerales bacterium]